LLHKYYINYCYRGLTKFQKQVSSGTKACNAGNGLSSPNQTNSRFEGQIDEKAFSGSEALKHKQ